MRHLRSRKLLGFINVAVGGALAFVGLILLLAWLYLGVTSSFLFNSQEIPFLALGFLVCFGLVAYSGVKLLCGASCGFPLAVAACFVALVWGSVLFYMELSPYPQAGYLASDIAAPCVNSFYQYVLDLIPMCWVSGVVSALMLTLSRHGSSTSISELDSSPEGLPI